MIKSPFQHVYPKNGRTALDGGLNSYFDATELADNELTIANDVIYDEGRVKTRKGFTRLSTHPVVGVYSDGIYTKHNRDGTEELVGWFGGSAYQRSSTTWTAIPSAAGAFTSGTRVFSAEAENYIFFGNGASIPYKWNGTDFTRHGIYAPTTTFTVSQAATGTALLGDYRWGMTWVNTNLVESELGPLTTTLTLSSQNGVLTNLPVAPQSFGVSSRNIYRTRASGTIFYRAGVISNNTATTYEDATADGLIVTEPPDDATVPPNYSAVITHQGRLFAIATDSTTNVTLVQYTPIGNPYVFEALNFIYGDNSGNIPTALAVYDNSIVVFCKKSIGLIYMPSADDTTWVNVTVSSEYGCYSPKSLVLFEGKLFFAACEKGKFVGIAAIQGGSIKPDVSLLTRSTIKSDLISKKIDNYMVTSAANNENVIAGLYDKKVYIHVPSSAGNGFFCLDLTRSTVNQSQEYAWSRFSSIGTPVDDVIVWNGSLYISLGTSTYYYNEASTTDGFNTANASLPSTIATKDFYGSPEDENYVKDWRWINLLWVPHTSPLKIYVYKDHDPNIYTSFTVSGTINGRKEESRISLDGLRAKSIRVAFINEAVTATSGAYMEVIGMGLSYNLRGLR